MHMIARLLAFVSFITLAQAQTWTQLTPAGNLPAPRAWTSAVFDTNVQRMIVFGGQSTGPLNDAWSLATGATQQWLALNPGGNAPQPRLGHAAGYDARNSRMIVFGGGTMATPPACLNDVWTLNNIGNTGVSPSWTPVQTAGPAPPSPRIFHTGVYDPNTNRLIVFGGKDCFQGGYFNDVWVLSNVGVAGAVSSWTKLQVAGTPPSAREGHAAAFDVTTNRMIVFGGDAGSDPLNDVWVLNNANGVTGPPNWSQVTATGVGPAPRTFAVAVWDTIGNRLIVNGGASFGTTLSDTFSLSGFGSPFAAPSWTQLQITGSTPSKSAASAVFDAGSNRMLVFAGNGAKGPQSDTWALSLAQQQTKPLAVTTTQVPDAQIGTAYNAQLSAANGTPPYSGWTVASGSLPPGLTLNAGTGVISGTPTTSMGSPFSFTVTVKDSTGAISAPQALTIGVTAGAGPVISTTTLPNAMVGSPYSAPLAATGGTPPYGNWVVASGALPPGLTLNISTGVIGGIPATTSGSPFNFTVTVRDNASQISPPQALAIAVISGILISPTTLPGGTVGVPYSVQLTASNGVAPYTNWMVTSGALPAGLTLNAISGLISGTPTAATNGPANFTVTVQDARNSTSAPQALSIAVATSLTITSTSLPGTSVSATYAAQLTAAGGTPPYNNWLVVSGTLPGGLTLSPTTGAILGVPLTAGNFTFGVTVKDTTGAVSQPQNFAITVAARVNVTTTSLPGATAGTAYAAQLTAADGVPPYSNWTVSSGTLPAGLTLNAASGQISGTPGSGSGTVSFSVTVKDSAGGTSVPQSLSISFGAPPALKTAPASLTFTYRLGDPAPAPQSISVFSGGSFTVSATSDQNFLVAAPLTGQTPAALTVSINISGLRAAGTLNGQVAIALASSPSTTSTVPVMLTVVAPPPAQLQISPPRFSLSTLQGAPATHLQLAVLNDGGGTLNYTASLKFVSGANWASLDNTSGSAPFGAPGSVGITINSAALNPGVYEVDVTVQDQGSNQSQTAAIILSVNAQSLSIQLSESGMQFTATAGGAASPPQTFTVSNPGQGALTFGTDVQVASGPDGWLIATPARMSPGGVTGVVTVSVDASHLTVGQFFGRVRITAPSAANSPQIVTVLVNVIDAAQGAPVLDDAGALIVGDPAVPIPPPAQIAIANLGGKPLTYVSTASTEDGKNWLSFSTPTGTLPVTGLTNIGVQANFSGLTAGVRHGTLQLAFSDGTVHTVSVTSILPPTGAAVTGKSPPREAGGCSPQGLVPAFLSLEPNFTVTGSAPVSLRVAAADTCGNPLTSGGVYVRFSDGSNGFALTNAGNGNWTGTWVPANTTGAIRIVATAFSFGSPPLGGQTPILSGTIRNANIPLAHADSIYDGASFKPGNQVSAGSSASLFGDGLADGQVIAPGPSFGPSLGATQVLLGDQPLPLLTVNATQVNALIPRTVVPNTQQQLVVQRGSSISVPIQVTVADVGPGIYTINGQGTGQGVVEIANTLLLAAPAGFDSRPAQRGETIMIFMTGLGQVDNPPPDGAPAPLDSLVQTLATPVVTIGDAMAAVQFSGLAPGLVGYYQVNATVPGDAPSGDAVPLVVSVNDKPSNPVTIAIQ
jgi:uncharacterized protein (TIGR03437 family)